MNKWLCVADGTSGCTAKDWNGGRDMNAADAKAKCDTIKGDLTGMKCSAMASKYALYFLFLTGLLERLSITMAICTSHLTPYLYTIHAYHLTSAFIHLCSIACIVFSSCSAAVVTPTGN